MFTQSPSIDSYTWRFKKNCLPAVCIMLSNFVDDYRTLDGALRYASVYQY